MAPAMGKAANELNVCLFVQSPLGRYPVWCGRPGGLPLGPTLLSLQGKSKLYGLGGGA